MKKFEIIDDNIIYKYQIYSGTRYHRGVVLHTFEGTCVHTPVHLNACILYLCSGVYLGGDHDCAKFPLEKRNYCNKENDKALTDCPVAAPAVSSICVSAIHVHYMYEH